MKRYSIVTKTLLGSCHYVVEEDEEGKYVKYEDVGKEICHWVLEDEDMDVYFTECEQRFSIYEGTPEDNSFGFCVFCGRRIVVEEEG